MKISKPVEPKNMGQLLKTISCPSAWHRPWPFFVLNDEYEPGRGEKRLTQLLESLKMAGFGGVYIHPRPGLITEYLSPRWFEIVRHSIREAGRIGLHVALYDENSYPSGFAGGHVPALRPEARVRHVSPKFGSGVSQLPGAFLSLYRWDGTRPGVALKRDEVRDDTQWIAFTMTSQHAKAWNGEFSYVSLLDPVVTPTFLQVTHERYREELGPLWKNVESIFTDEPHLPSENGGCWDEGLHCTPYVLSEFRRRTGYDLAPCFVDLYFDSAQSSEVRHDFYEVLHALWVENWAMPLEAWCKKNKVPLTGHYLEHEWPLPYATPGQVHCLAHMDWPGTDMLECFLLEGHSDYDLQNFSPQPPGREPQALYCLRQVHSVANQYGKERVMDESWGAGGHDSRPVDWLRIGRWLIVHGVNHLVPHHSLTTIRGSRKMDHPQFFSEQSPWFGHLGPLNEELGRLCALTSVGSIEQRVLVLDPLTTGFCRARKADCVASLVGRDPARLWADTSFTQKSVFDLREDNASLAQALADRQVDFDLGDEYLLEESGRVTRERLNVGRQSYQLVVWPPGMTNLRSSSVKLLEAYLAKGGRLCGIKPPRTTVNGRADDFLAKWSKRFANQMIWAKTETSLCELIEKQCPPRVGTGHRPGLAHQHRIMPDGEIFVFVNSGPDDFSAPLKIETKYRQLAVMDPATGGVSMFQNGDPVSISATKSLVILAASELKIKKGKRSPAICSTNEKDLSISQKPLKFHGARRLGPNVLVLDTCTARIGDGEFPNSLVYAQNEHLWKAHGFSTRGWANTIQYRDQLLARNATIRQDLISSFDYEFSASAAALRGGIRLAVECPEVWKVSVNRKTVSFSKGRPWLDHRIAAIDITSLLHSGKNAVTLVSSPFDVRQELDQIYLLGDFQAVPCGHGFTLEAPKKTGLGAWKSQGLPFYDRAVEYRFLTPTKQGVLQIPAHHWHGAAVEIHDANGVRIEYGPSIRTVVQAPADGIIGIVVIGLPKNLLGPLHDPEKNRKRAWPTGFFSDNTPEPPYHGDTFDLLNLGLFAAPEWASVAQ